MERRRAAGGRWLKRIIIGAALVMLLVGVGRAPAVPSGVERAGVSPLAAPEPPVAGMASSQPPAAAQASPPKPIQSFPFLAGEDRGRAQSLGDTSHGSLVNGVAIEQSEALGILPAQREHRLVYASESLAAALRAAAQQLHDETGTRMWIGHVARRGGGDIPFSVSHNSGRDVDIALCYRDRRGEPADPTALIAVTPDGFAVASGLRFDAARTWTVVKALVTFTGAQVQYLFVSGSLEGMILEHAMQVGEEPELIERAGALLRQPGRAAPHDDHLHLRVYCSEQDVLGGCINTGQEHPWAELYLDAKRRWIEEVARMLRDPRSEVRAAALHRLALLGAADHSDAIAARLQDGDAAVRQAAVRALLQLAGDEQLAALTDWFDGAADGARRREAVVAAAAGKGAATGRFLAHVLAGHDDRQLQRAAIAAADRVGQLAVVPALTGLLASDRAEIRGAAARALRRITNISFGTRWTELSGDQLEPRRQRWRDTWAALRKARREAWLVTGFRLAGYRVLRLHPEYAWELLRAVAGREYLSHNAAATLADLFAHQPSLRATDTPTARRALCAHWLGWLDERRALYELEPAPERSRRACRQTQ